MQKLEYFPWSPKCLLICPRKSKHTSDIAELHLTRPNKENYITLLKVVGTPTKTYVESQIWLTGPSLGSLSVNTKYSTAKLDSQNL